jgi:putative transcriptional regulator
MEERHVKVGELARISGLSRPTISDLRHHSVARYGARTLARLCKALDVSPGVLLLYLPKTVWLAAKADKKHPFHRYTQ